MGMTATRCSWATVIPKKRASRPRRTWSTAVRTAPRYWCAGFHPRKSYGPRGNPRGRPPPWKENPWLQERAHDEEMRVLGQLGQVIAPKVVRAGQGHGRLFCGDIEPGGIEGQDHAQVLNAPLFEKGQGIGPDLAEVHVLQPAGFDAPSGEAFVIDFEIPSELVIRQRPSILVIEPHQMS